VLLVGQKFSAEGLSNFAPLSVDPANLSSGKDDTAIGFGLKFGYQGEVSDGVRVGVSYQSKVQMEDFDKYAGLFANGGNFDIPATYTIGIAFEVGSSSMIVADIQEIKYSGIATISNPISNLLGPTATCNPGFPGNPTNPTPPGIGPGCLGGSDGGGFGWEDMTVYKIGYQVDVGSNTFRVGYSHTDQPIPESQVLFNVLAPAVIEDHITLGWTLRVGDNQELNVSGMVAPSNSVKGNNPVDGGSTQIEIEMAQWEVQAGWAWRY
jgi:long-chain fatty acid transport protein